MTDEDGLLLCAPPKLCDSVALLKQHLEECPSKSLLRLIYACNNEEAVNYLSNAFGISSSSVEQGERSFRDWMQDERHSRRASHKAIRWRPAFDIARGVICTAFGLDFGSLVVPRQSKAGGKPPDSSRGRHAQGQLSLHRQRVSVYMQRASSAALPGPRVTRFNSGSRHLHDMARRDTVIVCEYSSGEAGEIVSASALLGLSPEPASDSDSDPNSKRTASSTPALQAVTGHIFDGLYQLWGEQVALVHEPHAELEDHIYAQPADSSRARDVWAMSQRLHTMLKLVNRHSKVIEAVQDDFAVLAERADKQVWLHHVLDDFEMLADNLRTDYLEPLENMIDLVRRPWRRSNAHCMLSLVARTDESFACIQMYKSVTIRDSKQSLELNASLWRLSWITFIFLPLTFLVGAFGMNVDALAPPPSIKWYFVAVVPLVSLIFGTWGASLARPYSLLPLLSCRPISISTFIFVTCPACPTATNDVPNDRWASSSSSGSPCAASRPAEIRDVRQDLDMRGPSLETTSGYGDVGVRLWETSGLGYAGALFHLQEATSALGNISGFLLGNACSFRFHCAFQGRTQEANDGRNDGRKDFSEIMQHRFGLRK